MTKDEIRAALLAGRTVRPTGGGQAVWHKMSDDGEVVYTDCDVEGCFDCQERDRLEDFMRTVSCPEEWVVDPE